MCRVLDPYLLTWRVVPQSYSTSLGGSYPVLTNTIATLSTSLAGQHRFVLVGGLQATGQFVEGYANQIVVGEFLADGTWFWDISAQSSFVASFSHPLGAVG